jgi:Zn-dependent alcohol dehydrogenase
MGIVEAVGDDVVSVRPGDRVFTPFLQSCGRCEFCRTGLHTSCVDGGSWNGADGGAQAVSLDGVPGGYRTMDEREAVKMLAEV